MRVALIENQKTTYSIVVPESAAPVEHTAAEELKQYLNKVFSVEIPIVTEKEVIGKAFYIGHTDYAKGLAVLGKSKENWIIKVHNENVVLTGGAAKNDRGIIYAVYHFLEDIVGVRWWSYWEEYVPELTELFLEDDFYKEGTPAFYYRKINHCYDCDDYFYYEARSRCNVVGDDGLTDGVYHPSIKKLGGAMPMGRPWHVHTIDKYFPAKDYFEAHPDWFSWSDLQGERVPYGHYCLSSEGLCDALLQAMLAYIEEDQRLAKEKGVELPCFYDISFPDYIGSFCQCEACKVKLAKFGPSGYAIEFVNKIARAVAEKYPDVKIETLVYSTYLEPPKDDILPEKNVIIRMAQVFVDIIHGIHDRGNSRYLRLLKEWSAICEKAGCEFYIWEYMYNLFLDFPMPIAYRLNDTFRTFHEYGVKGVFIENRCLTTDMWELNQFMLTHLLENPYADEEALIDDFIEKFYGLAATYVKAYLLELKRAATENDFSVYCIIESAHFNYIDVAVVKKGMVLLEQAMKAVKGDAIYEERVRYIQTLLGVALLLKFRDLKNMAKKMGESFDFDAEAVRQMVISGLQAAKKHPKISSGIARGGESRCDNVAEYLKELTFDDEDGVSLPQELASVNPADVYQFFFKNISRHVNRNSRKRFGFSVVNDPDACTGRAARMCMAEASAESKALALFMTSCEAEHKQPLIFEVEQDSQILSCVELYREDVIQDGYHLYKVGSVSNISASGDTRINIFANEYEWLSLSGISVLFPMDACDVYLYMKFTGEAYGGDKNDQDAIYIDRAIVVRKA